MKHNHDKPITPIVDTQNGKQMPSKPAPAEPKSDKTAPTSDVKKPDVNKAHEMNHDKKQHGDNPSMGMKGHDHHAMMIADFKKRFYLVLILTVPIMLLSTMIQKFIGVDWQFTGSRYILLALSTAVFFYGGWPFFKGLVTEIKTKNPGMMFLIGFAITSAYIYSTAVVFGTVKRSLTQRGLFPRLRQRSERITRSGHGGVGT